MYAFESMDQFLGLIEIVTPDEERLSFPGDSVLGFKDAVNDKSYYVKPLPGYDEEYTYLERVVKGKISLYENLAIGYQLYAEKDTTFALVYEASGPAIKEDGMDAFLQMVSDDPISTAYVQDMGYRFKEFLKVVRHYNRRNYKKSSKPTRLLGTVYLYRTPFQKTHEHIRVLCNGVKSELYINDFIQLDLPVTKPTRVTLFDSDVKNTVILAGNLHDQYYEVLYDKKTDSFVLDLKEGTELAYEFFKIRDKVDKKMSD